MPATHAGPLLLLLGLFLSLAACTATEPVATVAPGTAVLPEPTRPAPPPSQEIPMTLSSAPPPAQSTALAVTTQRQDGNRVVAGMGALPGQPGRHIVLPGEPQWVVGAPFGDGVLWAVLVDDGDPQSLGVFAVTVNGDEITPFALRPERVDAGPPVLEVRGGEARLMTTPGERSGPRPPVSLDPVKGIWAYALVDGGLLVLQQREPIVPEPLAILPLPDGRLLTDGAGRLLLLTDPTDRYAHGVLGDALEASSVTLVETEPEPRFTRILEMPAQSVIEGLAPIWTDWDGDGMREIVVTQSDAEVGARIVLYNETGDMLAAGPAIGRGNRWRHQLAVAPFGPGGEMELADVLTPHLGGVVEFYRWQGDALTIVASVPGYTSHVIGSRNLDMAVAGDFDGDGRVELVLPDQARTMLGAIRRTDDGAGVAWTVPLPGQLVTNLAAATLADGSLALATGVSGGRLLVWQR